MTQRLMNEAEVRTLIFVALMFMIIGAILYAWSEMHDN